MRFKKTRSRAPKQNKSENEKKGETLLFNALSVEEEKAQLAMERRAAVCKGAARAFKRRCAGAPKRPTAERRERKSQQ